MAVIREIVQGDSLNQDFNYYVHTISYIVTDVTAPIAGVRSFIASVTPGIPQLWDAHPAIPLIVARRITTQPVGAASPYTFIVDVEFGLPNTSLYGPIALPPPGLLPENALLQLSTRLVPAVTFRLANGNFIEVERTVAGGEPETQKGKVETLVPQTAITAIRREPISFTELRDKSRLFVGKINEDSAFGDPKHFWIVADISGRSEDLGTTFVVNYEFIRNEVPGENGDPAPGWNPDIIWTDETTGQPWKDATITPPNGVLLGARVKPAINFASLNL